MRTVPLQEISEAAEKWKEWNLSQKSQIEPTLQASVEAREQSLAARKNLADVTKQFKKSIKTLSQTGSSLTEEATPENVATAIQAVDSVTSDAKRIVNSYKEEIDNLTRRCKSIESAYTSLAQTLQELPDPAIILLSCAEEVQTRKAPQSSSGLSTQERDELMELRREVAEYEVEFRSLKNQDITIRKLEAKIVELQAAAEEQLQEQLAKAREELIDTEGRRAAEALEREASMARKVQKLELELKAERAGREATQAHLLDADEGVSQREAAWEAQKQIFTDDLDRLREVVQITTREKDELQLKVAALQGKSGDAHFSGGNQVEELILERDAYEAEVSYRLHVLTSTHS
jgi:homeobox protein cut-like